MDNFEVVEVKQNYSIVSKSNNKFLLYNDIKLKEGNIIYVEGELVNIANSYNDFYNYLNKSKVNYKIDYQYIIVVDNQVNLDVRLIDHLLENKSEKNKDYLELILFNEKNEENKELYNYFSLYSISYLVAISGLHINIMLSFLKKIFKNEYVGLGFCCIYLYLLNFSISIYRAFLCYIFKKVNKKLNFDISSFNVICMVGIVFLFKNPCDMFSLGFSLSFLSSLVLELFKLYKASSFKISLYVYLVNIPIILLLNYKISILSFWLGFILGKPIAFLYIFSLIYLFLDKFYLIYEKLFVILESFFYGVNKFNYNFIFGKPSIIFIIIYYLLLILFFVYKERREKSKYLYLISLFLLLIYQYNKPYISSDENVYFLNVGQGDCTIFIVPNSKSAVLVDTGGSLYKDVASNEIIPFLESKGINQIDNIILTHDDFDHVGALSSLRENFNVKKVTNTSYFDYVYIGNRKFTNLNKSINRDNDGSIVLYGVYGDINYLLMGDASTKIEDKIIDKIDKVDVLKIGHHGSSSSSDYNFLKRIKGTVAIISVGANNKYGHPHESVLNSLIELNYIILRTDIHNDIGFRKSIFNLSFVDYFD